MSDPSGFESPEAAALAGWAATPGACARVVSITVRGDRAEVVIDTEPTHPDYVYCVRRGGEWFGTSELRVERGALAAGQLRTPGAGLCHACAPYVFRATVKTQVAAIYAKPDVTSRTEAVVVVRPGSTSASITH